MAMNNAQRMRMMNARPNLQYMRKMQDRLSIYQLPCRYFSTHSLRNKNGEYMDELDILERRREAINEHDGNFVMALTIIKARLVEDCS